MKPIRKSNHLPDLAAVYDRMNSRSFNGLNLVQHQHTVFAARKLATMALARLDPKEGVYFQSDMPQHEYRRWVLIHKETVTPEGAEQPVRRFTFQIVHQTEEPVRAFLPGEYVELQSKAKGQIVVRPYTPIKGDTSRFCIYVKIYSQGLMSNHMSENGQTKELSTATKLNMYASRILMNVARPEDGCWKKLFMIAGGTGVSPCIQLIKHHLKFLKMASMHLLFANNSIVDVIDPLTLDHLVTESKMRLTVTYTFSKPPPNWHGLYGHVNAQMLKKWLDNVDGRDSSVGGDVNRSHSVTEQLRQEARNYHKRSAEEVAVLSDWSTDDEDEEPRALDMDDEDGAVPLLRWPQKEEVSKEGVSKSEGRSSIQRTLSISTKPVTSDTHLDGDVKFVACGPIPMLDALELAFGELGIPETQLVLI
ncbi:hypothetical protein BC936DRAFT_137552 [Jimgerdemannia flammicorona]|uniref:FAD-binding FR-type domain-containing protein n=1 Tax=Jimgerdemannia flammicorona TaxID=994334 RepID=A0A433CX33_9FUNG|nr:hypothetical protein BC936DRAFT_137552 [Jimgerdemannia flammicorona]